ncbi:transcription factor tfiiib component [Diaporthe eres]|uniref:SANT domain-containing protein n=1 Tax=Diaporthe vaccinii TaxID=105482 RepID=A0ABR4F4S9_9PEZI|nr:transcription factor tfiiib component [Diaporthe eres]
MSSMLKKGAGAFKPKAPIARRRPAPAATAPVTAAEPQTESPSVEETASGATRDAASSSTVVESRPEPPSQPTLPNAPPAVPSPSTELTASTTRSRRTRSPEARRVTTATKGLVVAEPQVSATPTTVDVARPAPNDTSHSEPLAQTATTTTALPEQTENGSVPTQDLSEAPRPTSAQGDAPAATKTKTTPRKGGPSALKPARSTPAKKAKSTAELTVPSPAPTPEVASTPSASTSVAPSVDNGEGSSATSTAKTRKPAARQPRKRKAPAGTAESEADTGTETAGPPKKKRAPRRKKAAANGEDSTTQASGAENGETVAPKKRAPRKKKTAATSGNDESGEGADGETPAETEGEETERTKKARRKRSVTPEDAEQQKVDHEQMVMSELTRDLRIGAKFSKYDELRDRIRKKRARQRLIKLGKLQPGEEMPDEHTSESGTPAPDAAKKPAQAPPRLIVEEALADSVPQLEIVDGHIRINEASMQYDRHAAADQARGVVFEQEEDDFTTPVTQRTYMRRQPQGNFWTDEETIKFYHGLRMFGTDFNMISKMFGGAKNRRQVKLKFNREERANPVAVNKCIIGEKDVPMDLEAVDGADALEDSQAITDELARLKAEQEAETRRQEEEEAATNSRKKDELFGRRKGDKVPPRDGGAHDGGGLAGDPFGGAAKHDNPAAAAAYGVGTDPDVIDETDLPSATTARGRARGGGRARKAPQTFAGGIGG